MRDLSKIFPLIVPSNYFIGDAFPAPHQQLKHPELSLTWVLLEENQTMIYVTKDKAIDWERNGIDFRKIAMDNLLENSTCLYTHEKRDEKGNLIFVAMMHEDGLGSSRLLLNEYLLDVFPQGYNIALPERSVGLVFSINQSKKDIESAEDLIYNCYKDGNTPMMQSILMPKDLELI